MGCARAKRKPATNGGLPIKNAGIKESGTEIGHSLEFDFVVPPPHS